MSTPEHHKQIANHLRSLFNDPDAMYRMYRDSNNERAVAVGQFTTQNGLLFSTTGISDSQLNIPPGAFEFAGIHTDSWIGNAVVDSIYWLQERSFNSWPLVCEDICTYYTGLPHHHMAFAPSTHVLNLSGKHTVSWLLGMPLSDSDIGINKNEMSVRIREVYPMELQ